MVPTVGLYQRGLLKSLMDGAIPLFSSDDRSNRACFSLSLFVGVRARSVMINNTQVTPGKTTPGLVRQAGVANEDSHA